MSYEVFIITLQGDYYDDPIFQKITEMRVNHLGANLGTVTEQSFWLQVWDTVSCVRDASGLHHQGRELGLGWRCRQSHGGCGWWAWRAQRGKAGAQQEIWIVISLKKALNSKLRSLDLVVHTMLLWECCWRTDEAVPCWLLLGGSVYVCLM